MPDLEFVHDYSLQDHTEVMQSATRKWLATHRERYFWLVFLGTVGFFILMRLDASELLLGLYGGGLAGWLLTLYSFWKQQKRHWSAMYEENPSFRDQLRTVLTQEGLRRHGTKTEFFCTWSAITSSVETANLFVLYLGKTWFITIPKRVCETPGRLEELRSFLSAQTPKEA